MADEKNQANFNAFRVNLQVLMDRNGLNKTMLADKLGIAMPTLSRYLSGTRKPDPDYAITIAKYFGVSLDWLFGMESDVYGSLPPEILSFISAYSAATEGDRRVVQAVLDKYNR